MISSQFWSLINSTPSNNDWRAIEKEYEDNKKTIDVDFEPPSAPGETILWHICLKQKTDLAERMICHQPNADFTRAPHEGQHKDKTIPLLISTALCRPLFAHIIASRQALDFTRGPQPGLTPYWVACNYKWWHLVQKIHKSYKVNVDIAPNKAPPPIWLAANARELDIVMEMLQINPRCTLDFAPLEGKNKDRQALWFILDSEASKIRTAVINIFIFLKAPSKVLPESYIQEYSFLKNKQLQIREESLEIFIKTYPEIAPFIDTIKKD